MNNISKEHYVNHSTKFPTSGEPGSPSNNTMQVGFDFGEAEEAHSGFALHPLGTWGHQSPALTVAQHEARFKEAEARVLSVVGPSRPLFEELLRAERAAFALQVESQGREPGSCFSLWGARHVGRTLSDDSLHALFDHCEAHAGANYGGIVYKVRVGSSMAAASIHVPGLGSLAVRSWAGAGMGIDYTLIDADSFFLDSYLDARPEYEFPYSVWGKCSGGQKLAEAGKAAASLPTFTIAGREYVQTGSAHGPHRREANAWLVGSLSDWRGPTFGSYQEHIAAYDAGTIQRGDHRGLLVKVRGVLCVLVSAALVFDANAAEEPLVFDDESDEDQTEEHDAEELAS